MGLIADGLLFATAITAAFYCFVLSRRLQRLTDSGAGIGAQIEALDKAMAEVRDALAQTKSGVSELRGSAQTAMTRLGKETAQAREIAAEIAEAVRMAKATMERLYEARDRVEAAEARAAQAPADAAAPVLLHDGDGGFDDAPEAEDAAGGLVFEVALAGDEDLDAHWDGDETEAEDDEADDFDAAMFDESEDDDAEDEAGGVKVALPEGKVVVDRPAPPRASTTLKVERMML